MSKTWHEYLRLYELDKQLLQEFEDYNYYPSIHYGELNSGRSSTSNMIRFLDKKDQIENYVRFVEEARQMIGGEFFELIMRDYFDSAKWYRKKYSASTYYRRRREAQQAFVQYMDSYQRVV